MTQYSRDYVKMISDVAKFLEQAERLRRRYGEIYS
jgi:hypothetical protein